MPGKQVTIRVQALDGIWETIGVDRLRGVWPENDTYKADSWGSSTCSFDLHRDPGAIFPDLLAFTPIEVEIGGVPVWSGRVLETPTREADRIFNVQGQGWQYHLDDDTFNRVYIDKKISGFKDSRSLISTDLATYTQVGALTIDRALTMGWGQGANVQSNVRAGATYDAGPDSTISQVLFDLVYRNGHTTAIEVWIAGTVNGENPTGPDVVGVLQVNVPAGTAETNLVSGATFATPCRYVHTFIRNIGAATTATAGEIYARIRSISLIASSSYTSGGASVLHAGTIITDALARGTSLLSTDRSGIGTPSFFLDEFTLDGQKSVREVWQAANAVQDWQSKIDVQRRPIFQAKPSAPRVEIGAWPGSVFDDASANSGDDIYNRVIVEGSAADGGKMSVQRSQGQQPGSSFEIVSSPAASNPSFAVDASSWTPSSPTTMSRTTTAGTFDTAPAGGQWLTGSGVVGCTLTETFTGTFQAGVTYRLTFVLSTQGPTQGSPYVDITWGTGSDVVTTRIAANTAAFSTVSLAWTPVATYPSGVTLKFVEVVGHAGAWLIDTLTLSVARPTLIDRRGFRRTQILPVQSSLNSSLGQQVGDTWLAAHKTTPLKGSVQVTGDKSCREITTGASIPPERLLTMTGELLRLSHRVDPDTGGQGRDGRIAEVTYTPETDTSVVSIDSTRTSVEALLARLAVVVGNGST